MKNRLKNYNFWISIFSAVLLILQALKIEFDIAYVNEIFTAVLGLLVVVGIIIDPTKTSSATAKTNISTLPGETSANKEILAEQEKKETEKLPIAEESKIDIVDNENDIKNVLNKISIDLENKLKQIENLNKETAMRLEKIQNKTEQEEKFNEVPAPAAAEMENPYLDLMQ